MQSSVNVCKDRIQPGASDISYYSTSVYTARMHVYTHKHACTIYSVGVI